MKITLRDIQEANWEFLKEEGLIGESRSGNVPAQTCVRGHDKTKFGRQQFTKNGRKNGFICTECTRVKQRVGYKKNQTTTG